MGDVLQFFMGTDKVPPLGFTSEPELHFCDGLLALASTCSLRLTLPISHSSYESFKYCIAMQYLNDSYDEWLIGRMALVLLSTSCMHCLISAD